MAHIWVSVSAFVFQYSLEEKNIMKILGFALKLTAHHQYQSDTVFLLLWY